MIIDSRIFLEIMLGTKSIPKSAPVVIFENISEDFIQNHFTDSDFNSKCIPVFTNCNTVFFNDTCPTFNFYMINSVVFPNVTNIYSNSHFTEQMYYRRFPKDYWHFTFCNIIPNDYEDTCVIMHSEFHKLLDDHKKQIYDSKSIFTKIYEKTIMPLQKRYYDTL